MKAAQVIAASLARPRHADTTGWFKNHVAAWRSPRTAYEQAIVTLVAGLALYADAAQKEFDSPVGEDGVLGEHWMAIASNVQGLLNGEHGRLDAGTVDSLLRDLARAAGFSEAEADSLSTR